MAQDSGGTNQRTTDVVRRRERLLAATSHGSNVSLQRWLPAWTMADCIFCSILAGTTPASFVFRDDVVAAFMDIRPVNLGHVLVVPVRHAPYMADMTPAEAAAVMLVAQRTNAALRASSLQCEGVNYFLADGEAAMQEVFHAHLHVFPRFKGDGFGLRFSPEYYTRRPPRPELDRQAAELCALLPSV